MNPTGDALSVVMCQFSPEVAENEDGLEQNIQRIYEYIDRACTSFPGVDLIVVPEYTTTGFGKDPYANISKFLTPIPGPITEKFGQKAREKGVWLCVSVVEKGDTNDELGYNTMVIIDSEGAVAGKYRKMIPWCPKEPWTPGSEMMVCEGPKGSRLAIAICSDFDYPEVAREAAWKGANVMLRPSKYMYPWDHIWDITNMVRAYENQMYVVAVNHTGHDPNYSYFGRSMAVDFDGQILAQMGENAGMTKVDLYPALVEKARNERSSNNYLYQLKHRGFTGVPPQGVKTNPFSIYRDWDHIPEPWDRPLDPMSEEIATSSRNRLQRALTNVTGKGRQAAE